MVFILTPSAGTTTNSRLKSSATKIAQADQMRRFWSILRALTLFVTLIYCQYVTKSYRSAIFAKTSCILDGLKIKLPRYEKKHRFSDVKPSKMETL